MNEWLEKTLKELNLVDTMDQPIGFTRLGYSVEELESIKAFKKVANELDLMVHSDQAGNTFARWEGATDFPVVMTGSHLDTVESGGGYDGVAGVLCALGAIKRLKEKGFQPKHPIEVVCFASEESARFGVSTIGSKSVAGILDKSVENVQDRHGVTIKEAIESTGLNWSNIEEAERPKNEIKSFVELHIEQGTQIEDHRAHFGIVRGVACPIRLKVKATGMAGHTGTTPMGKRKDALVALAPLITYVSQEAERLSAISSKPLVATVSTMEVKPNGMNVIPGYIELGIDIRSVDDSLKRQMADKIIQKCTILETKFNVTINIETLVDNPSILLDEKLTASVKAAGEQLGYISYEMDSGAGHDVMNMAAKWPSALIFIPCEEGISHHPKEHSTISDLQTGVDILTAVLQQEAGE
ncbi:N-carbamoyl-L-amino-acid hydrolase [Bacillus pakistanensis]|uniref:N-carbamoyl-L-amino-acid hydrolase n=1 Tax=Rossellomorea pakistanensis TaxID=992288 RepID=A0ABS2ND11_9BACI|nr:M20 family metallo-hydrolase [Bacillus pakistanensis]MBM7585733.1 N-carbamoyl-L-amino-acid hydrolase [Bacillus pakistanensis]